MSNRFTTESPCAADAVKGSVHGSNQTDVAILAELTDAELQAVAGGINPQPLPPHGEFRFD